MPETSEDDVKAQAALEHAKKLAAAEEAKITEAVESGPQNLEDVTEKDLDEFGKGFDNLFGGDDTSPSDK